LEPDSALQSYLDGALAVFGIEADETERAVMAGVWKIYAEGVEQLMSTDLTAVEPEPVPDLSRPPKR
jgi:hypothetical protein